VRSILPLCERVLILDDHSEDGTPEICRSLGERVVVIPSPFDGLDESRDKNYLLGEIGKLGATWCLCIDGDEILEPDGTRRILAVLDSARHDCYALRIVFLWNGPGTVRVDGVYGQFSRPSLFRLGTGAAFPTTGWGGHFHCGNVPTGLGAALSIGARLYHLGYMRRADRLAKYGWYVTTDPLDGTTNALRGLPFIAVSLAGSKQPYLRDVEVALVSDLLHNATYTAKRNGKAFRNGEEIQPSQTSSLEEAVIGVDFNTFKKRELVPKLIRVLEKTRHLRHFGANALELCYVADGTTDAFIDLRGKLRVTDIAAAYLILREAGGTMVTPEGSELNVSLDASQRVSFVAAANSAIYRKIRRLLVLPSTA